MDLAAHLSKKNFFQHLFHVFHCVYLVLLPGFQVQIHRLFNLGVGQVRFWLWVIRVMRIVEIAQVDFSFESIKSNWWKCIVPCQLETFPLSLVLNESCNSYYSQVEFWLLTWPIPNSMFIINVWLPYSTQLDT